MKTMYKFIFVTIMTAMIAVSLNSCTKEEVDNGTPIRRSFLELFPETNPSTESLIGVWKLEAISWTTKLNLTDKQFEAVKANPESIWVENLSSCLIYSEEEIEKIFIEIAGHKVEATSPTEFPDWYTKEKRKLLLQPNDVLIVLEYSGTQETYARKYVRCAPEDCTNDHH